MCTNVRRGMLRALGVVGWVGELGLPGHWGEGGRTYEDAHGSPEELPCVVGGADGEVLGLDVERVSTVEGLSAGGTREARDAY